MSMVQMKEYLGPGPRGPPAESTIYNFFYADHIDYEEFINKVPGSTCAGIGFVGGWNYHINQLGQPNIRRNFMGVSDLLYGTTVVVASPSEVALDWTSQDSQYCFGWVMQCKGSDYALLDQVYGKDRVRILLTVRTSISNSPPRGADLPCLAYWDPRNTQDLGRSIRTSQDEHNAWRRGFQRLGVTLCPKWYIARLDWITHGKSPYIEPLLVHPSVTQIKIAKEKFGEAAFHREKERVKASHLQSQKGRTGQAAEASGVRAYFVPAVRVRLVIKGVRKDRDGIWKRAEEVRPSTLSKSTLDPPREPTMTRSLAEREDAIIVEATPMNGRSNVKYVRKRRVEENKVSENKIFASPVGRQKNATYLQGEQRKKIGRTTKVRKTREERDKEYTGF